MKNTICRRVRRVCVCWLARAVLVAVRGLVAVVVVVVGVAVVLVRRCSARRVSPRCLFATQIRTDETTNELAYNQQSGAFSEDMIPTVGFNMKKVSKGNVTIKLWDIGGQPRFRSMWERYCRGVNAIV